MWSRNAAPRGCDPQAGFAKSNQLTGLRLDSRNPLDRSIARSGRCGFSIGSTRPSRKGKAIGRPPKCSCNCQPATDNCGPAFPAISAVFQVSALPSLAAGPGQCNNCPVYHNAILLPFVGVIAGNCTWQSAEQVVCPSQGGTQPAWTLRLQQAVGEFQLFAGAPGGSNTLAEYLFIYGLNPSLFHPLGSNTFTSIGNINQGCITFPNTISVAAAP